MRAPLSLRVDDGDKPRFVTRHASGLSFRKTAPGGHHSLSVTLSLPRDLFAALGPNDKVYVDDGRTGRTVWEGYTENPGSADGAAGEGFDLSAMGGQVLASDHSTAVVFMERSLDSSLWIRRPTDSAGGTEQVIGSDNQTIRLQFPSGIPVGSNSGTVLEYFGLYRTGQRVAAVTCDVAAGKTDAGYTQQVIVTDEGGLVYGASSVVPFSTTPQVDLGQVVVTDFPATCETAGIAISRAGGATNVADDLTWGDFSDIYVRPILADASGADVLTGFGLGDAVYAHEVVNHILGTMLPSCDAARARVDTAAARIEQLAYHDGATPRQILDNLALWEPDFLWEILESTIAGKHQFNYRAWPTSPRYEISTRDGYAAPGGDADLCNRVVVYWTDAAGSRQSTVVTSTVPELGSRVRDAQPVTLPPGRGNANDALRVGQMVLAAKASPPRDAKATVTRPLFDYLTGGRVMPWEIEPGYLVRVRETGDDLRLTEVTYSDDRVSADLTLGTPQRTVEQMVASLAARR